LFLFAAGSEYDVWARTLDRAIQKDLARDLKIVVKKVPCAARRISSIGPKPDGYSEES
jgi:hypothetical protein